MSTSSISDPSGISLAELLKREVVLFLWNILGVKPTTLLELLPACKKSYILYNILITFIMSSTVGISQKIAETMYKEASGVCNRSYRRHK